MKKILPIGIDSFEKVRENGYYYVDKTLMIQDFIETQNETTLIARPRRFGKTLNMTMVREFFDIIKNSVSLFDGLAIMDTAHKTQINSRPTIFITMKDCKGETAEELLTMLKAVLYREYARHEISLRGKLDDSSYIVKKFYQTFENLLKRESLYSDIARSLLDLIDVLYEHYKIKPLLLIDEYDQPIMSSYEYGYHHKLGPFFSSFYGSAMKGNDSLGQALLTGVQRVAKESIFSQFNNPVVYTVASKPYASYFGLTEEETCRLLADYGFSLDEKVRRQYDGYRIGGIHIYNPWSVLNYADSGFLDNYWVNTSSNFLVRQGLEKAGQHFWDSFHELISEKETVVWLTLDTSYAERDNDYSLWGLLVNAGYLTMLKRIDANAAVVKIPNGEVMSEFQSVVSEISGVDNMDMRRMFDYLIKKDMDHFLELYQTIVITCTSYMDAKENAYHMLFLGMCISLRGLYEVTSNIESGHGRSDITLKATGSNYPHIIIEFKQGDHIETLSRNALAQILDNRYYTGLKGEVICIGIAHNKKKCSMISETIQSPF